MEVDPVQQRAGDLFHIPLHIPVRAGAAVGGMAPPAAAAGVHGADQLESGRQMQRAAGTGHSDRPLLQGLAHSLQHVPAKFRQLVQKQNTVVGQGHLPRPQGRAAAGQCRGGGGVVGRAEGAAGQQGVCRIRQPGHRPDAGGLQGLPGGQVRQNGGQPFGQHGLAGTGRADEQQVMSAGGSDLQRPFYVLLPHHVPQVRQRRLFRRRDPWSGGRNGRLAF